MSTTRRKSPALRGVHESDAPPGEMALVVFDETGKRIARLEVLEEEAKHSRPLLQDFMWFLLWKREQRDRPGLRLIGASADVTSRPAPSPAAVRTRE